MKCEQCGYEHSHLVSCYGAAHYRAVKEAEKNMPEVAEPEPITAPRISGTGIPRPRMRVVARGTPTLGTVGITWANAIEFLAYPMNSGKAVYNMIDTKGGEIAESRNKIVQLALGLDNDDRYCSHLFWVDDDVIISQLALLRLMEHDRDIASGVYFTKGECPQPLIFPHRCGGTTPFVPDKLIEAWGCGMGLTLVKMELYRRMRDELDLGVDKYGNPKWYHTFSEKDIAAEDGFVLMGGTEDLYFCEKAKQLGVNPLIDTGRWCFGWHYDNRSLRGYPLKQWEQYINKEPVTWDTPEGVVEWR